MTETKKCTMCGEEKSVDEFRLQTRRNREDSYRRPYCKDCEAIEVRRQYLLSLANLTPEQQQELTDISKLYGLRLEKGLKTFGTRKQRSRGAATNLVSRQLEQLKELESQDNQNNYKEVVNNG